MLKNLRNKLFGKNGRRGFTLLELVTVIGIIAVSATIAIPSLVSQNRTTKFKQHNDYAQSIFMAAQANLSQMRSQGRLGQLETAGGNAPNSIFPAGVPGSEDYRYVTSEDPDYDKVLPEGSIDSYVRSQAVVIEFNPFTGNVFSVFYGEDEDIFSNYIAPGLPRGNAAEAKKQMVGYYAGSAVDRYTVPAAEAIRVGGVSFEHKQGVSGGDGKAYLSFYIQNTSGMDNSVLCEAMEVSLVVFGESGGSCEIPVLKQGKTTEEKYAEMSDNNHEIRFKVILDGSREGASPETDPSFVNHAAGNYSASAASLIADPDNFKGSVKPGDNITVIVRASFTSGEGTEKVAIDPAGKENINPMFGKLKKTNKLDEETEYWVELLGEDAPAVVDWLYARQKENLALMHENFKSYVKTVKTKSGETAFDDFGTEETLPGGGV